MDIAGWISAAANVAIALGLSLTWFQIRADHDRSRRERAVEFILGWARNLDRRGTAARKLVEKLPFEQAKALFQQEAFEIDAKHHDHVESVFLELPPVEGQKFQIDVKLSAELRWLTVTYLNNLEAVIAAWRHKVADERIIAEQFRYLVSPVDNQFILERFRQAANGDTNYPAIAQFVRKLRSAEGHAPSKRWWVP